MTCTHTHTHTHTHTLTEGVVAGGAIDLATKCSSKEVQHVDSNGGGACDNHSDTPTQQVPDFLQYELVPHRVLPHKSPGHAS